MWRLHCSLFLVACASCSTRPPPPPVPVAPAGRWVDGDVHVHSTGGSNDTDSSSFPADLAAVARTRGLDFLILTDHSNATGGLGFGDDVENHPNVGPEFPYRDTVAALSVPGEFVMLDGNEISPIESLTTIGRPRGHVGCLPKPGDPFRDAGTSFAFIDRPPGAIPGGDGVKSCHSIGGFAVINHPFTFATWTAYDWTSFEYDAIEVWNGGLEFDAWDLKGMQAWWCDRALGRTVAPIGASDCHRAHLDPPGTLTDPALGVARTLVFVPELSAEGVTAGIAAGRTVAHDWVGRLEVWAGLEGTTRAYLPGDRVKAPAGATLRFHLRGHADRAAQVQVLSVGAGECVDHRTDATLGEPEVKPRRDAYALIEQGDFELTLDVAVEPGRDYAVRLWHPLDDDKFQRGLALSNALRVE